MLVFNVDGKKWYVSQALKLKQLTMCRQALGLGLGW